MGARLGAVALATIGAVSVGGVVAINHTASNDGAAVVERVVDGDTVDVTLDGKSTRIRLLNLDTPEIVDPNRPPQCLGQEASAYLKAQLPLGSRVDVEYDQERTDRYGRTLAILRHDHKSLSVLMVEAGYGVPVTIGRNAKHRPAVDAAFAQARLNKAGLFGEGAACTVPAQVKALDHQADTMTDAPAAAAVLVAADKLTALLGSDALEVRAFDGDVKRFRRTIEWATVRAKNRVSRVPAASAPAPTATRTAPVAPSRAAVPSARLTTPAARSPEASRARTQAPVRTSESARRTQEPQPRRTTQAPQAEPAPRDTYTGCRAYGPTGTSVDNKGRRYTPIPCS